MIRKRCCCFFIQSTSEELYILFVPQPHRKKLDHDFFWSLVVNKLYIYYISKYSQFQFVIKNCGGMEVFTQFFEQCMVVRRHFSSGVVTLHGSWITQS